MLDAATRDGLGLSGAAFLERLDAGEFDASEDESVVRLRMLAPFGR